MAQWLADSDADWTLEWLGLEEDPTVFPGYGDAGADTFVLDIEQGFTVKHSWITNVIKFKAGNEQRISRNDIDRESYAGAAYLSGVGPRATRAKLARHAANGAAFLLGLPHEALTIRADSAGTSVPVHSTALVDWAKRGQRVVVVRRNTTKQLDFISGVVQSKTANTIVLDVAPGAIGKIGGWIMPAKAIYLEPQQSIPRYRTTVEKWNLAARVARPLDFAPTLAELALGPITPSAALDNVKVVSRQYGLIGNAFMFSLQSGGPAAGQLVEADGEMQFNYSAGVTTLANLRDALNASSYGKLDGVYNPADTIAAGDTFALTFLSGAADTGDVGTGVALVLYDGRPVWDPRLTNASTNTDGVHAMTEILDRGGIPYALGTADRADWFRAVTLTGGSQSDWQWFKLFMATVKAKQKKFWLPTWRDDLTFVSKAANTITVSTTDGSDFSAWWPAQREHIQVVEANGTVTRAKITAAVDNGNGTRTLTIGVTLATSNVTLISWLELCRFDNGDEYETKHNAKGFDVSLVARVVP